MLVARRHLLWAQLCAATLPCGGKQQAKSRRQGTKAKCAWGGAPFASVYVANTPRHPVPLSLGARNKPERLLN